MGSRIAGLLSKEHDRSDLPGAERFARARV
jgi:hypothetical protein